MAFAETANLAIKLTVGGNFKSQFANASKQLRGLDKDASRAYKAGTQIGTGIKRSAILVVAAAGTIAGALAYSIKVGQEAANTQKIYANAIVNSGKASAQNAKANEKQLASFERLLAKQKAGSKGYKTVAAEIQNLKNQQAALGPVTQAQVAALNAQQTALMNLAGVDDELIKSEQTRLIQMGFSGKATEKLTPLILDAAKATGKDLLTVTVAAGKAALGNATALQRLGIVVDKTKFKINPLAETIRVLNQRFGGTTKALSGSFDVRMAALRENINNIAEDVGIKLLPSLTRIVGVVGQKVVPALGKMVDRLLPDVIKNFDAFASALESGAAENAIRGITDALGPMIDLVKIAAQPVKEIVKAFLSLPKEVQTVLVGAFAVNKLTGGLVTNVAGGIIESLGKAFIGGIKAPLVNVNGGVVNVNGGAGGAGDLLGAAGKGGLIAAATSIAVGIAAGAGIIAVGKVITDAIDPGLAGAVNHQPGAGTPLGNRDPRRFNSNGQVVQNFIPLKAAASDLKEAASQLRNAAHGKTNETTKDHDQVPVRTATVKLPAKLDALHAKAQATAAAVKDADSSVRRFGNATVGAERAGAGQIVAAVRSIPAPVTTVNTTVNVTAGGIKKTVTVHQRYGPVGGSASDDRHLGYTPGGA